MEQAPFHLHCVICFDAFDLENRPPVVLPCGHTYLCEPCSKRLKRCMECRTPLFHQPVVTAGPTHERHGSNGNPMILSPAPHTPIHRRYQPSPSYRYGYQNAQQQPQNSHSPIPPTKVEQIPLPCPKNLVLMSIMEAAQRRHLQTTNDANADADADKENEFEAYDNNTNILNGIAEVSNSSGTYVVREANGLWMQPQPSHPIDEYHNSHLEHNAETKAIHIKQGQQVQIAEEQDGVYVLSRKKGFIVASNSQIVKGMIHWIRSFMNFAFLLPHHICTIVSNVKLLVGPARDLSCQIEGTLCSVQNSRRTLLQKVTELEEVEVRLLEAYRDAVSKPTTQPIIQHSEEEEEICSSQSCHSNEHGREKGQQKMERCLTEDSLVCKIGTSESGSSFLHNSNNEMTLALTESDHLSPGQSIEVSTPTPASPPALNHSFTTSGNHGEDGKILFMEDSTGGLQLGIPGLNDAIDELDLSVSVVRSPSPGSYLVDDTQSEVGGYGHPASRSMMCGSSIFPLLRRAWSDEDTDDQGNRSIDLTYQPSTSISHLRPRASSQSNPSTEQGPYDSNTGRSFDGVDFRTGLSGHNALNRRHKNKSHNQNGMVSRREIRMMSEHRGIGSIRKLRQPHSPRC